MENENQREASASVSNPLVSIITPVYNSEEFIEATAQSIFMQTLTDWEWLAVDDGSTDRSFEVLCDLAARDRRITVLRTKGREGAAVARNMAISVSNGRFIAFLDSDDLWEPEKLAFQTAFMIERGAAISHTSYSTISEDGTETGRTIQAKDRVDYNQLLNYNMIGCLTAMYDTFAVGKVLMPKVRLRQDYGLWLKILRMGHQAHGLNMVLSRYRIRSNSVSSNKLRAAKYTWKVLRHEEKLTLWKALWHFINYVYQSIDKYLLKS